MVSWGSSIKYILWHYEKNQWKKKSSKNELLLDEPHGHFLGRWPDNEANKLAKQKSSICKRGSPEEEDTTKRSYTEIGWKCLWTDPNWIANLWL